MFIAILQHTPVWVWGLLAVLVTLGLSQTRSRELSLTRVTVLPLVLLGPRPRRACVGGWR